MPDPTSLYPQAPQQTQAPINPAQALDLLGKFNALQHFQAQRAVGEEAQRATREGVFDPNQFLKGVAGRPDASLVAPEAVSRGLAQQGQTIANTTSQYQLDNAQTQALHGLFGSLADEPKLDKEKLWNWAAATARRSGIPAAKIDDFVRNVLSDKEGLKAAAAKSRAIAIGPAGLAQRVEGPPGPGGEPTSISLGQTVAQPGPQGIPTGLPVGGRESALTMQHDLERAKGFGQEMFPWEEALAAADKLETKYGHGFFAPGSKGRQEFQSFFYGISPSVAKWLGVDAEKIKDYAKADKYLTQAVQQRAAGFGVHTDQGLATTISGSPNVSVNDLAVKDLIKASIALRRAEHIQALTAAKSGGPGYNEASAQWPASHDIRALTLDKLDPAAREKLLGSLKEGTPEYDRFNRTLREAYDTGVMVRPQKPEVAPTGVSTPPVPGATKAPDGEWYVPDPSRGPNKYLRVKLSGLGG